MCDVVSGAVHFQGSVQPAACGIDSIDSSRYSVRSVLGVCVIEHVPWIPEPLLSEPRELGPRRDN
eukprot:12749244-Alexandrium_andersonii.AAC.1